MKVQTTAGEDKRMSRILNGVLVGALALAACTGDSPLTPSQKLQTTSIRLATGALAFSALGDSAQIQVYGEGISPASVSWSVTDPTVAAVQGSGVVKAVSDGTTFVVARVGRWTDSAQVTVAPQPTQLVIQPQVDTLSSVGATAKLSVAFYDRNGNQVRNQQVSWSSLNAAVVSADANGKITGLQPGTAQVVAKTQTLADTATVLVLQAVYKISLTPTSAAMYIAQTTAFSAVAVDSKGFVVSSVPITWTSSNPAVAIVSNGMVTGIAAGSATITASGGGQSATSSVNVKAVPVSAVVVSPSTASTTVGAAVQFTAQTLDASGSTLTNRTIAWSSSNTSVATVSSSGLVSAVAAGQATITATSETVSGTASFTSTQVSSPPPPSPTPVAAVTVSPSSVSLAPGGALQLAASTSDASGNVLTGRSISWTSSAAAVATVSATGLVTAVAAGQATIVATSEGVSGGATVTVSAPAATQPAPVASVSVTPTSNSLVVGGSVQLSATTKDVSGNVLTGRVVAWSSSAPAVATVSSTGLVTAVGAGQATINAVSETVVGSASESVAAPAPAAVAKVTLAPSASTTQIGGMVQLSATATDANGNVLTGRTVTWSSMASTIASVSATGLVTALAAGSATINASVDGVVGSAAIVVAAPTTGSASVLMSDDFESGDLSKKMNTFSWGEGVYASVSSDIAHSGTHALKFHYSGTAPNGDAWSEQRFRLGQKLTAVWFEYWIYFPNGTEGLGAKYLLRQSPDGSNGNKFFALWGDVYGTPNYSSNVWGLLAKDPWHPEIVDGDAMQLEEGANFQDGRQEAYTGAWPNPHISGLDVVPNALTDNTTGSIRRGRWVQIRLYFKLASPGQFNGESALWIDGVKAAHDEFANLPFGAVDPVNNYVANGYLMGWSNTGFDADTNVYVDDFKAFTSDPGWN